MGVRHVFCVSRCTRVPYSCGAFRALPRRAAGWRLPRLALPSSHACSVLPKHLRCCLSLLAAFRLCHYPLGTLDVAFDALLLPRCGLLPRRLPLACSRRFIATLCWWLLRCRQTRDTAAYYLPRAFHPSAARAAHSRAAETQRRGAYRFPLPTAPCRSFVAV